MGQQVHPHILPTVNHDHHDLVLRAGAAVGSSDRLVGHGRTGSLIPCPRLHWHPHPCLRTDSGATNMVLVEVLVCRVLGAATSVWVEHCSQDQLLGVGLILAEDPLEAEVLAVDEQQQYQLEYHSLL